jgi:hypothetical protein
MTMTPALHCKAADAYPDLWVSHPDCQNINIRGHESFLVENAGKVLSSRFLHVSRIYRACKKEINTNYGCIMRRLKFNKRLHLCAAPTNLYKAWEGLGITRSIFAEPKRLFGECLQFRVFAPPQPIVLVIHHISLHSINKPGLLHNLSFIWKTAGHLDIQMVSWRRYISQ